MVSCGFSRPFAGCLPPKSEELGRSARAVVEEHEPDLLEATPTEIRQETGVLSINILPGQSRVGQNKALPVLVSVKCPEGLKRTPCDFCCVLDVSGSMYMEASIVDRNGRRESHGLTLLDIARHGVRTAINMLTAEDRFALVTFSNEATTVLELTAMDDRGKALAEEALGSLRADGGTFMWKGLQKGLEALRSSQGGPRIAHMIVLTDGDSTDRDLVVPKLAAYKEEHSFLPGTINTFGFGCAIDSRLLSNVAIMGDGTYSFIPDPGFVGTAFVNSLCNLLVTFAHRVYLTLEAEGGAEIKDILGNYQVERTRGGCRVNLGTLQYGQSRDIVVILSTQCNQGYLTASGEYQLPDRAETLTFDAARGQNIFNQAEVDVHKCRYNFVDTLVGIADTVVYNRSNVSQLPVRRDHPFKYQDSETASEKASEKANSTPSTTCGSAATTPCVRMPGRAPTPCRSTPASSNQDVPPWMARAARESESSSRKWSGASLAQSARKLLHKGSNVSSEPGSKYKQELSAVEEGLEGAREVVTELSRSIQDAQVAEDDRMVGLLEDINGQALLAVSKPEDYARWGRHYLLSLMFAHQAQLCNNFKDAGVQQYGGNLFRDLRDKAEDIFDNLPVPKSSVRMAVYNDRNAGCIDGESLARTPCGKDVCVKNLRKGDLVLGPRGEVAEVVCVVRMQCEGRRVNMVELPGGARLTPHHPVLLDKQWVFPANVAPIQDFTREVVYNFVIRGAPGLLVGGIPCTSLGHGLFEGAASHPYFSSERASEEILQRASAKAGLVDLLPSDVLRDPVTGLVCGLRTHDFGF